MVWSGDSIATGSVVSAGTAEVLAENQFNEEVDGVVYASAPVSMTLVSAGKEPLSSGFNLSFEIRR
ncbi:MAG: hypothetical protein ACI8Y4_004029 [Candidatus Poriferisodalaceae bacterium]|jgi:hypothetical protein